MAIDVMASNCRLRPGLCLLLAVLLGCLSGCGVVRPRGILYTNVRLPLTRNLHHTPVPMALPYSGRTLEIQEPITGLGLYVQVDSNAIGDIARERGMQTLYFADREVFSILGIWTTDKTVLFGE